VENANLVSGRERVRRTAATESTTKATRRGARGVFVGSLWLASALMLACATGCDADKPVASAPTKTVADYFEIRVGGRPVRMQIAVREAEMARGLMDRRDLGRDEGMLFVYDRPQRMGFWMRNTPTPLDIGFFSRQGVLEEIYPMHPFDESSVQSRGTMLSFALEVNQGWFREHGVKPGAQLDLKALAAALEARGFEPRRFGLEE
jgi:uncharacterized membrane protein (UPF0127 family)